MRDCGRRPLSYLSRGDLEDLLGLDKLEIPDVQSQLKEQRAGFGEFKKDTEPFKDNQTIVDLRNELRRDLGRLSSRLGEEQAKKENIPSIQIHPDKRLHKLKLKLPTFKGYQLID